MAIGNLQLSSADDSFVLATRLRGLAGRTGRHDPYGRGRPIVAAWMRHLPTVNPELHLTPATADRLPVSCTGYAYMSEPAAPTAEPCIAAARLIPSAHGLPVPG